jgi:hypothetical protein
MRSDAAQTPASRSALPAYFLIILSIGTQTEADRWTWTQLLATLEYQVVLATHVDSEW